ncbi:hypothetical protein V8F20_004909 [Naviculisporaceae sp. PSN 640]
MGKNKTNPQWDSQGRLIVNNPHRYLVGLMMGVYLVAAFISGPLIWFQTACDTLNGEKVSGHARWLYTLVFGLSSFIIGFLGMCLFAQQHGKGWYIKMAWYPPVYATFLLLWIIEFGWYAGPFLNADSSIPGMTCMKRMISTSEVGIVAWALVTLVSIIDWKRFGYVEKYAGWKDEGGYESSVAPYPINDYMPSHNGVYHGGSFYHV